MDEGAFYLLHGLLIPDIQLGYRPLTNKYGNLNELWNGHYAMLPAAQGSKTTYSGN
jgi:hypothetical protein